MGSTAKEISAIRFGTFELDRKSGELRRNGSRIKLQEQPLQVLLALLERPGEVVTRDELRGRLWQDGTFVDFDHSLNTAVRRLRDALSDSAENPRFVETVARRGYRFLVPVSGPELAVPKIVPLPPPKPEVARRLWLGGAIVLVLLLFGVILGWLAAHPAPAKPLNERRLTANAAELSVHDAAISPDGRYLAFADASGFYLRQIDTGETHALVLPNGFNARPRAWLPDAAHILATWVSGPQDNDSIWEISLMGGNPRKLADRGAWPAVSPDGSSIVFLTARAQFKETYLDKEIWVMHSDGSGPHLVLSGGEDFFGPPAWSPDGRRLAYVRAKYGAGMPWVRGQLETFDLATRETHVLVATPTLGSTVAWAPDGRLIYSLDEPPPNQNDSNLWSVLPDVSGRVKQTSTRLTRGPGLARLAGITADGKRLAYFRQSLEPDVYVTDLESRGARLTPPRRLTLDERADFPYSWTPDNKSVIFVSDRNGAYNIYRQGVDQAAPELLIGGREDMIIARLSPDNRSILYLVTPPGGETAGTKVRLMRAPLQGGSPQTVLEATSINNHQCARLPSTVCIFSTFLPGKERFFTFDPDKGVGQEIPKLEIDSEEPMDFNWSLSPDGRMLVMAERQGPEKEPTVRLLPFGDGEEKLIPVSGWAGIATLDWAADGRSVWAAAYNNTGERTLLNVSVTGKITPMLPEKTMTLGWAIPSPDGKHLALWKANGNSNVWMLENF